MQIDLLIVMRKYSTYPFEIHYRITPTKFTNCITSMNEMRNWQRFAVRKGLALKNHINVAHNGKMDDTCAACKELASKVDKAKVEKNNA